MVEPSQTATGPLGRLGFESGSDAYEQGRPDYPTPAVQWIVDEAKLSFGTRTLDVAAGTGKLTRALAASGTTCTALEPSPAMQKVFRRVVPGIDMVAGTAEALPFVDDCMQAVVVAQAFHWFDPSVALREFQRVLKREGVLALIWNERDESDPTMAELSRLSRWAQCRPYPADKDFGAIIDASGRFGSVVHLTFDHDQHINAETMVAMVASRSYVQTMEDGPRQMFLGDIATFAAGLGDPIVVRYQTDLFVAHAQG